MRRLLPCATVLLTLAGTWVGSAAAQVSSAGAKAIGEVRTEVTPAQVTAGQAFSIIVRFEVRPGLHIQAAKPLQDFLIGTQLTAEPVDGIVWGEARYPEAKERSDPTLGNLAEYTGQVRIELPGVVQTGAKPEARPIKLHLRYQACTDEGSCYPPKTVPVEATLMVVPGTAADISEPAGLPPTAPLNRSGPSERSVKLGRLGKLGWEPFSAARVAALTAAGKTVLIDFTADWCPNCKLNELIALNTPETAALVRRNGVVPLLADFTHEDAEIQAWLGKFNSISVPLTVIIPGGRLGEPILLRDTYRQATLLKALEQAGPSMSLAQTRPGLTLQTPIVLAEQTRPIWYYLLAGFVGGFILNFMPCVLPVISIKVLSLLGQAGQSHKRVFGLGLAFSAGMIALFLTLGVLVTLVGQTWGALFQSTTFLVVMLGILVAMACSLFGAFSLGVPGVVGDADAAIEGEGYVGSFGKGVLAVLLGTPCSGPLLGATLAWAAAKAASGQATVGMSVFLAMGLGMAFPFLVLAAKPGWMRFLPRPGAWMETFKQAMGFLLLLSAVYILYLMQDRMLVAVLYSIGVAFAAWLYGRLVQPGRTRGANWVGRAIVAGVVAVIAWGSFVGLPAVIGGESEADQATRAGAVAPGESGESGQPITANAVPEAAGTGR